METFLVEVLVGYIPFFWRTEQYLITIFALLFIIFFPLYWYIKKLKTTEGKRILLFFKYIGVGFLTTILTIIVHFVFMYETSILRVVPEIKVLSSNKYTTEQREEMNNNTKNKVKLLEKGFPSMVLKQESMENSDFQKRLNGFGNLDKPESFYIKIIIELINGKFYARNSDILWIVKNLRQKFKKGEFTMNTFNENYFYSDKNKKVINKGLDVINSVDYLKDNFNDEEKEVLVLVMETYILIFLEIYEENKGNFEDFTFKDLQELK